MSSDDARDLRAIWFGDEVVLLGHLHMPRGTGADLALVICPAPFGFENTCGHRGLRILADRVADAGIPALRFDVPGVGDSDGVGRVAAWTTSVADAVAALRRETGRERVVVMGVGLGGTVAVLAADSGLDVDGLILWGAPDQGRRWLREQRAHHRVTAGAPDPGFPPPPPLPDGVEDLSGFPLLTDLAADLAALDLAVIADGSWPEGRARPDVLAISRTSRREKSGLAAALAERGLPVESAAWDGYDKMFDVPHLSIAPEEVLAGVTAWLTARRRRDIEAGDGVVREGAEVSAGAARAFLGGGQTVQEIARYSPGDGGRLFSVESRPGREPDPTWIIFLTGRAVRHIGANRMWVRFAREFAADGFASLRLDGRSVGDSDGEGHGLMPNEEYYQPFIWDDVQRVMEIGIERGARRFLMIGNCSGATASYEVAWQRSDVDAIVLLNPLQLRIDPADSERAYIAKATSMFATPGVFFKRSTFRKVFHGNPSFAQSLLHAVLRAPLRFVQRGGPNANGNYVVEGFHGLAAKGVEIDIFLSEGDASVDFLERFAGPGLRGFERDGLRVVREPHTDHTLRPLFSQDRFLDLVRTALVRVAAKPLPSDGQGDAEARARR